MNPHSIAALASLALLASCSDSEPNSGPATTTQPHAVTPTARAAFKARCTPCHGETGHGDGPFAVKLNPKPPNFADVAWQRSVSDEQIRKTIVYGGAGVGKSPVMPAIRELESKPELDELLAVVRSFNGM